MSVFKSSDASKDALKNFGVKQLAKKSGESEEVVLVKEKLRRIPGYEDKGENELSMYVNQLTNPELLEHEFSHLYDIYDVVDRVLDEADTLPEDEFHTSVELAGARNRATGRLERISQLPVYLYLTDLQSFGESGAMARGVGNSLAASLTTLLDFEYGAHHAALMVGDVVVEWDDSSLVMPRQKDVMPVFRTRKCILDSISVHQ